MKVGERQVSPSLKGIRGDHRARYFWAASRLPYRCRILDAACGVGYGSRVLAQEIQARVVGIDIEPEAIAYAKEHYYFDGVDYFAADVRGFKSAKDFDAIVSFETIEHLDDPAPMLLNFRKLSSRLLCSVPNERLLPFDAKRFNHHFRHYTPEQFTSLLESCGWRVVARRCQKTASPGAVEKGVDGRTIVYEAVRFSLPGAIE